MISSNDALIADDGRRYDYVLTNPPFGKKNSMTFTNEEGEQEKEYLPAGFLGNNVIFFDTKPAGKKAWTKEIWFYDYRTNIHHTLKKTPLKLDDLNDFITCELARDIVDNLEAGLESFREIVQSVNGRK